MSGRPWLAGDCSQVGNLCWTGYIDTPDKKHWNVSYTPGVVGSWGVFVKIWEAAWTCLKWAFTGYIAMLKILWEIFSGIEEFFVDVLAGIPKCFSDSCANINSLAQDTPFGWIIRIIGNIIWTCFLWVLIKLLGSLIMLLLVVPIVFLLITFIACAGKFILGWIGTIACGLASPFAILGGVFISGCVTCGGMCNRFPRESDSGTYGLYIVPNNETNNT